MGLRCMKCGRTFADLDAWERHTPCRRLGEVLFNLLTAALLLAALLLWLR